MARCDSFDIPVRPTMWWIGQWGVVVNDGVRTAEHKEDPAPETFLISSRTWGRASAVSLFDIKSAPVCFLPSRNLQRFGTVGDCDSVSIHSTRDLIHSISVIRTSKIYWSSWTTSTTLHRSVLSEPPELRSGPICCWVIRVLYSSGSQRWAPNCWEFHPTTCRWAYPPFIRPTKLDYSTQFAKWFSFQPATCGFQPYVLFVSQNIREALAP